MTALSRLASGGSSSSRENTMGTPARILAKTQGKSRELVLGGTGVRPWTTHECAQSN